MVRSTAQFDLRIRSSETRDVQGEIAKLRKEEERLKKDIEQKKSRLADTTFRERAPSKIIEGLEATVSERQREYEKIVSRLAELS